MKEKLISLPAKLVVSIKNQKDIPYFRQNNTYYDDITTVQIYRTIFTAFSNFENRPMYHKLSAQCWILVESHSWATVFYVTFFNC